VDATSRKCREASFDGADGVVAYRTLSKRIPKFWLVSDHPVCAEQGSSDIFLIAQPPLLCKETSEVVCQHRISQTTNGFSTDSANSADNGDPCLKRDLV
jgi:hypothetical protein